MRQQIQSFIILIIIVCHYTSSWSTVHPINQSNNQPDNQTNNQSGQPYPTIHQVKTVKLIPATQLVKIEFWNNQTIKTLNYNISVNPNIVNKFIGLDYYVTPQLMNRMSISLYPGQNGSFYGRIYSYCLNMSTGYNQNDNSDLASQYIQIISQQTVFDGSRQARYSVVFAVFYDRKVGNCGVVDFKALKIKIQYSLQIRGSNVTDEDMKRYGLLPNDKNIFQVDYDAVLDYRLNARSIIRIGVMTFLVLLLGFYIF